MFNILSGKRQGTGWITGLYRDVFNMTSLRIRIWNGQKRYPVMCSTCHGASILPLGDLTQYITVMYIPPHQNECLAARCCELLRTFFLVNLSSNTCHCQVLVAHLHCDRAGLHGNRTRRQHRKVKEEEGKRQITKKKRTK